ncbi:MAG: FadR/GntR family transcriptional regulator [Ostreibacterium sp.]
MNQRLYKRIAKHIKTSIENGELAIGEPLPSERELAKQLDVSRATIREAIIALEVLGWVETKLGSGIYVKNPPDERNIHFSWNYDAEIAPYLCNTQEVSPFSLLQARLLIEPEIAALAAITKSPTQLKGIKQAYLMNVEDNLRNSKVHLGDRLFHIRIAEAGGNDAYAMIIRELLGHQYGQMFSTLQRLYTPKDMPMRSQKEHLNILIAIEKGDAEAAKLAMQSHLQYVINIFTQHQIT